MRCSFSVLAVVAAVAACSSSSSTKGDAGSNPAGDGGSDASSGSGDGSASNPDAFIAAYLGSSGTDASGTCTVGSAQPWLAVGVATAGKPATVQDGGSQGGATVHVACSVTTAGAGFDVNLTLSVAGASGRTVTITSPPGQGAVTAAGATGITAAFQDASGSYQASDCSIAFTYEGQAVPDNPPVAAGRIWGHLSCPSAMDTQLAQTCDGEADFLFEECQQ